ncbi:MAG: alpha-1,2-fucosyltransferase [Myxococcales bacterium]|nr:alpha-1,2-fucosyltransferase [Myxococcales bacterium]
MSRPAVVVQMAGGLGNQLFEYAFGRALALRNGVPLILDHRSGFPRDFYQRRFSLERYNISCDLVPASEDFSTFVGRARRRVLKKANQYLPRKMQSYIVEADPSVYDAGVGMMKVTQRTYFEGVWQHEAYFDAVRPQLLEDFKLKEPVSEASQRVADRIKEAGDAAVCLHVRRLHGVPDKKGATPLANNASIHLDPSYYERAIAYVQERVSHPRFFVFADFPDWARENLQLPEDAEFVEHNGSDRDYEDIWLMTHCRWFVVANSTFSWWGAWLCEDPEKVVVAPVSGIGCGLRSIPSSWVHL